jgi:hypothetical protein
VFARCTERPPLFEVDGEQVRCFLHEPAAAREPAKEGVA